ncbi:hypothetical protein ACQFYA_03670 [Promicromonospora sp. Marseille-Q5078]
MPDVYQPLSTVTQGFFVRTARAARAAGPVLRGVPPNRGTA